MKSYTSVFQEKKWTRNLVLSAPSRQSSSGHMEVSFVAVIQPICLHLSIVILFKPPVIISLNNDE